MDADGRRCGFAGLFVWLAIAMLAGCIRMTRPPHQSCAKCGRTMMAAPPSPACDALSSKTMGLNLGAVAFGALGAGAATIGGIVDDPTARYSLAGSAAALGVAGAITTYLGGYYAARFSKECN